MAAEFWRERARDRLIEVFGQPIVNRVAEGEIYRWVLKRARGLDLYLTLDAPEHPHLVHLMVSDPCAKITPIQSIIVRTPEELEAVIEQIGSQWKPDPGP